jgi:hypothetical protein
MRIIFAEDKRILIQMCPKLDILVGDEFELHSIRYEDSKPTGAYVRVKPPTDDDFGIREVKLDDTPYSIVF